MAPGTDEVESEPAATTDIIGTTRAMLCSATPAILRYSGTEPCPRFPGRATIPAAIASATASATAGVAATAIAAAIAAEIPALVGMAMITVLLARVRAPSRASVLRGFEAIRVCLVPPQRDGRGSHAFVLSRHRICFSLSFSRAGQCGLLFFEVLATVYTRDFITIQ